MGNWFFFSCKEYVCVWLLFISMLLFSQCCFYYVKVQLKDYFQSYLFHFVLNSDSHELSLALSKKYIGDRKYFIAEFYFRIYRQEQIRQWSSSKRTPASKWTWKPSRLWSISLPIRIYLPFKMPNMVIKNNARYNTYRLRYHIIWQVIWFNFFSTFSQLYTV